MFLPCCSQNLGLCKRGHVCSYLPIREVWSTMVKQCHVVEVQCLSTWELICENLSLDHWPYRQTDDTWNMYTAYFQNKHSNIGHVWGHTLLINHGFHLWHMMLLRPFLWSQIHESNLKIIRAVPEAAHMNKKPMSLNALLIWWPIMKGLVITYLWWKLKATTSEGYRLTAKCMQCKLLWENWILIDKS